ncbi:hypothetical protein ACFPIJ_58765 [Dactylosporangium cerinum]|uniref:ESX-1 secretion-associated protein n=1 Tax=Dactylosporangium cerinum TaxID=1434730 RepID=A0ABV9WGZ0_9ACTN
MGDYVILGSTAADLLNSAQKIKDLGGRLTSTMSSAVARIDPLDQTATFGGDDFAKSFLHGEGGEGGYHQMVPSGVGDEKTTANQAVKTNARKLGEGMTNLGQHALDAMWAYTATDDDGATDIDNAART